MQATTDGVKATYSGDGTLAGLDDATEGDYVILTQDKVTENITGVAKGADWAYKNATAADAPKGMLEEDREYDAEKLVLSDETELTLVSGGAILLRYTEEGSVKHKVVTYSDVNTVKKAGKVWFNKTFLSTDGKKIQSDMIVVEFMGQAGVASVELTAPAAGDTTFAIGTIGTVTEQELTTTTGAAYTISYVLEQSTDQVAWTTASTDVSAAGGALTLSTTPVTLAANTYYRVKATTTDPNWDTAYSNVVKSPVWATAIEDNTATWATGSATTATITGLTATTSPAAAATMATGAPLTVTIVDGAMTTGSITGATVSWTAAGAATVNITGTALDGNHSSEADKTMILSFGTDSTITITATGAGTYSAVVS